MTKSGLTFEQHQELGLELARMRDRLTDITCLLARAYPRTAIPPRLTTTATRHLDRLRSDLERRLFVEHPGWGGTHVYYPSPEERHQ